MPEWPPVTIVLLTYAPSLESPRHKYADMTLRGALDKLSYSGEIHVHIADDGSGEGHVDTLKQIAGGYSGVASVTSSVVNREGYGASYNLATQLTGTRGGLVLPLEDDWVPVKKISLDQFAIALTEGIANCIRLGYIGFTQELRGRVIHTAGENYLLFDPDSPEPHVFAGHPRLESVEWERLVGEWPVGLNPGATEFAVAHKPEARDGVCWPLEGAPFFVHIGSVSFRETL